MDDQRIPPSGMWGMALGCTAWSVLLTVFFFAYGAPRSALLIGVPCVLLSVGFVCVILVALEGVSRKLGFRSRAWMESLWGLLFSFMGFLLLLANAWIGPAMEAAGMVEPGRYSVIGVTSVPEWIPIVLLVAGTVLLVRVGKAMIRTEAPAAES